MNLLSRERLRLFFIFPTLLILFPIAPHSIHAQSSPPARKRPAPPPPPPAEEQQQFISYWTTETGWRTELQLRNNQVGQILTVTPVLRATDGTETPLSPIVVQPQEVKAVDVATAIGSSAPQLIGVYGSLALRYRSPSQANLYAVAMVMGVGHSIAFHIDGLGEDQTEEIGSREGIWWLPNGSVNDYLILANQGQNPLQLDLSVFDAGGRPFVQHVTLPPRGMNRLSVRQLASAAHIAGAYGGIKASTTTHAGSLDTLHVLFDENTGFSAVMKMFNYDPKTQLKERDYAGTGKWTLRAPMLALPSPDPSLAFPVGTPLRPQLLIHNNIAKPTDASLSFNWHTDTANGQVPATSLHLGPFETRLLNVTTLQNFKVVPQDAHWASATLTTNGLPNEVSAVAASFDESLKFGAQTPFSDQLAFHWAGSQWEYDPLHDSIITAGNGGTKPTQAAFTIFYNQGTQKYELDQTLQPGEQMWMDIGKLIRERVPDKNGKTLPANLTTGSYEIRDLTNKGIGMLFEGKVIYDKTYGHVTYGCGLCCGYKKVQLWFDPLGIAFQGTSDDGVNGLDACTTNWEDTSDAFLGNWHTANSGIATVDYYATHTGQGIGSTTSSTFGQYVGWRPGTVNCPNQGGTPSGGVNVRPTISGPNTVWFFANLTVSGYATSITLTSTGGSSTTWNITAGANKITVSSFTGSSINVLSSGTAFSSSIGDVSITAIANGLASTAFAITTRTPNISIPFATNYNCDPTYGYLTQLQYRIEDQLGSLLPSTVPVNENWTTSIVSDYSGTNWRRADPPPPGSWVNNSQFEDQIQGEAFSLPANPVPTCDGNSTPVEHWGQEIRVGSIATGFGRRIQTDTLQKYIGYAAHLAIVTPAP